LLPLEFTLHTIRKGWLADPELIYAREGYKRRPIETFAIFFCTWFPVQVRDNNDATFVSTPARWAKVGNVSVATITKPIKQAQKGLKTFIMGLQYIHIFREFISI